MLRLEALLYYYKAKLKYARKYLGRGRLIFDMIQFDNYVHGVNFHVLFTVYSFIGIYVACQEKEVSICISRCITHSVR